MRSKWENTNTSNKNRKAGGRQTDLKEKILSAGKKQDSIHKFISQCQMNARIDGWVDRWMASWMIWGSQGIQHPHPTLAHWKATHAKFVFISWHFYLSLNYQFLKGSNYVIPLEPGTMPDHRLYKRLVVDCILWLPLHWITPLDCLLMPADYDCPLAMPLKHSLFTHDPLLILFSFSDNF